MLWRRTRRIRHARWSSTTRRAARRTRRRNSCRRSTPCRRTSTLMFCTRRALRAVTRQVRPLGKNEIDPANPCEPPSGHLQPLALNNLRWNPYRFHRSLWDGAFLATFGAAHAAAPDKALNRPNGTATHGRAWDGTIARTVQTNKEPYAAHPKSGVTPEELFDALAGSIMQDIENATGKRSSTTGSTAISTRSVPGPQRARYLFIGNCEHFRLRVGSERPDKSS